MSLSGKWQLNAELWDLLCKCFFDTSHTVGVECATPDCAVDMYSCSFKFTDTHHGHEYQGNTGLSKISLDRLIIQHTSLRVKKKKLNLVNIKKTNKSKLDT